MISAHYSARCCIECAAPRFAVVQVSGCCGFTSRHLFTLPATFDITLSPFHSTLIRACQTCLATNTSESQSTLHPTLITSTTWQTCFPKIHSSAVIAKLAKLELVNKPSNLLQPTPLLRPPPSLANPFPSRRAANHQATTSSSSVASSNLSSPPAAKSTSKPAYQSWPWQRRPGCRRSGPQQKSGCRRPDTIAKNGTKRRSGPPKYGGTKHTGACPLRRLPPSPPTTSTKMTPFSQRTAIGCTAATASPPVALAKQQDSPQHHHQHQPASCPAPLSLAVHTIRCGGLGSAIKSAQTTCRACHQRPLQLSRSPAPVPGSRGTGAGGPPLLGLDGGR